jgi:hypothetical protein
MIKNIQRPKQKDPQNKSKRLKEKKVHKDLKTSSLKDPDKNTQIR